MESIKESGLNLIEWARNVPLSALGEIFQILAERIYNHRKRNNGHVPGDIFESCLSMAGMSVSIQVVNVVVDDNRETMGFALKQRSESEIGEKWTNLYHSTCSTGLLIDTPISVLDRISEETFGFINTNDNVEFLGVTIHDEPERHCACLTVVHRRKIKTTDVGSFLGTWKIFTNIHDKNIIDHNQYILEWVSDPNRPLFANLKGGYFANMIDN